MRQDPGPLSPGDSPPPNRNAHRLRRTVNLVIKSPILPQSMHQARTALILRALAARPQQILKNDLAPLPPQHLNIADRTINVCLPAMYFGNNLRNRPAVPRNHQRLATLYVIK